MTDDRFDRLVREVAQDYHRPPTPPREEMWRAIVATRAARRQRRGVWHATLRWGVGIAAVLALGIAIGRFSAERGPADGGASDRGTGLAYRLAAAQYLTRTEALLTGFRTETRSGEPAAQFAAQARDLLGITRLMLDSPAAADVRLRALLEDLELVLAQIAQLPARGDREDVQVITHALEQRSVLLRLRSASSPAPGLGRTQGAL
jgi:hypothetical protein